MQWRCKQEIEDALWDVARKELPRGALDRKRLLQAITERTALYTTERSELASTARSVMPASDLAARALFFTIADAAKIGIPLSELASRSLLPEGDTWRVLDLGAGVGAMGLGILSFASDAHPGLRIEVDAVDLDDAALSLYQQAVQCLETTELDVKPSSVRCIRSSAASYTIGAGKYDLVVLGSVLNELRPSERASLARRAMEGVKKEGALIIIEPALRETSRSLHEVRDELITGGTTIFAPCTRTLAPCPALEDARDWCHEDRAVVLPSRTRQMSQATGLRDGGMKFSYLVARHGSEALHPTSGGIVALRVVGQPQRGKGQKECFVCGEAGRGRLRLLRRNRNSKNRIFDRAKRGDLLTIEGSFTQEPERTDITAEQRVEKFSPAEEN